MFGYVEQLKLATAMANTWNEAAANTAEVIAAFWGYKQPAPGRSWYKPPQANPFDWRSWLPSGATGFTPMAWALPWPATTPWAPAFGWGPTQTAWMGYPTSVARQELPALAWQMMLWPLNQANTLAAAAPPYAAYRSDGGHATAQIIVGDAPPPATPPGRRLH